MAENWIHDRPCPAPNNRRARRKQAVEQPRLELPVAVPHVRETEAQPAAEPQRGVGVIDFYV